MMFGDFNGDGRSDQVTLVPGTGLFVSLSDGARFSSAKPWHLSSDVLDGTLNVGDFDGNGRTDLLVAGQDGSARVFLSDGTEFEMGTAWNLGVGEAAGPLHVGDFDGDGQSDLLVAQQDGTGLDVRLSTGVGFTGPNSWASTDSAKLSDWRIGDFNGDGKADILKASDGGADIFLSTGSGFNLSPSWTTAGVNPGTNWIVGDFDGDGRSDIYRYTPYQLDDDVFRSNGQFFHGVGRWNSVSQISVDATTAIDFDGDGLDDIPLDGSMILSNTGFGFSPYFTDIDAEHGSPPTIKIPIVLIEGDAFTLSVEGPEVYSATIYNPSNGAVLRYIPELSDTARVELGEGFQPGQYYSVRLNGFGGPVAYTTSFKVVSTEAANEALALLDRFDIQYLDNQAAEHFLPAGWKSEVTSFQELSDYFVSIFEAENATILGASGAETAKALFVMQCVNQLWGYGNLGESTLPGRVIYNELFSVSTNDQIVFDLYLNSSIADCQDYAALTAFILTREGLQNRIVLTTGHVFNEVFVDGAWIVIDSTFGISYDRPYAEVLDATSSVTVLDYGRASEVYGSGQYRDLASGAYNQKIFFDAAGFASDPKVMSVADFYHYIPDGFIYADGLDEEASGGPDEPIAIENGFSPEDIPFEDFYNYVARFDRFDVSHFRAPSGGASEAVDDAHALAHAVDAECLLREGGSLEDTLQSVLRAAATGRSRWASQTGLESGYTQEFAAALGLEYSNNGFDVSVIETKGLLFLELREGDELFVIDIALGIVYVGDFAHVLSGAKVQVVVLPGAGTDADGIKNNLLKFQLGYYADHQTTSYADWLFTLSGGEADERHEGGAGDDVLQAGTQGSHLLDLAGGNDTLEGAGGNDRLDVERHGDALTSAIRVNGAAGEDAIRFNGFNRLLDDVQVAGGDGNDTIEVLHAKSASIDGGEGDDSIYVLSREGSHAQILGGAGADRLYLSISGLATIDAGDGDDVVRLTQGAGPVSITLGGGADRLILTGRGGTNDLTQEPSLTVLDFAAGGNGDVLDFIPLLSQLAPSWNSANPFASGYLRLLQVGLATELQVDLDGGGDSFTTLVTLENIRMNDLTQYNLSGLAPGLEILGTAEADHLVGGVFSDIIWGFEGADVLYGGIGGDTLDGGTGDDLLDGGDDNDNLLGRDDLDTLIGRGGDDYVNAGAGDDYANGGAGDDVLFGDAGDDQLFGETGADNLQGGEGNDRLDGGDDNDILDGGAGDDTLLGRSGDDYADGGAGNDYLNGGVGNDVLVGADGDDWLLGGAGADNLQGGAGKDSLDGGDDNDILASGTAADTLLGQAGDDYLDGGSEDDYLAGGLGADFLIGADGDDHLFGDIGDDNLQGGAGEDWLDGGEGNDVLQGGDGDDTLSGGAGEDYLIGGTGADLAHFGYERIAASITHDDGTILVDGPEGRDRLIGVETLRFADGIYDIRADGQIATTPRQTLTGRSGPDVLRGYDSFDTLSGGSGADVLYGGIGGDTLDGGTGDDLLDGGDDNDNLLGRDDLDTLIGRGGDDYVNAGAGDDYANGGAGDDVLFGDAGDDQLFGETGADNLQGGEGNDRLDGSDDNDILDGGAGDDTLLGRSGDDYADGGAGNDYLNGGVGNDVLVGADGDDWLFGEAGADNLQGGAGKDSLDGGGDNDILASGTGTDTLLGQAGDDYLDGGSEDDYLAGGLGADFLIGADGDDHLFGDIGDDNLQGGAGEDWLDGGDGNDVLQGGDGDDTLSGGAGDDYLIGGAGADRFVIQAGDGRDIIAGFSGASEGDYIQLLRTRWESFEDVLANSYQDGFDVIITLGSGEYLTLTDVNLINLVATDFDLWA